MYRRTLPLMTDFAHLESRRKFAIGLIQNIFTALEAVPRHKDQRKYRSQCWYFYHLYELGGPAVKANYEVVKDYYQIEEAIMELTKVERKLRAFWFY